MVTVEDIRLIWLPLRGETFCAMLGKHEVAFVMKRHAMSDWAWRISNCNGTGETGFRYAPTLEGAKAEVLAGVQEWFRQAGFN